MVTWGEGKEIGLCGKGRGRGISVNMCGRGGGGLFGGGGVVKLVWCGAMD